MNGKEIISMIRETIKIRPRSPPLQRLEGRLFCPVCGSPLQYLKAGNKRRFECVNPQCPFIGVFLARKREPRLVFEALARPVIERRETGIARSQLADFNL